MYVFISLIKRKRRKTEGSYERAKVNRHSILQNTNMTEHDTYCAYKNENKHTIINNVDYTKKGRGV